MFAILGEISFETLTSPESVRATSSWHYGKHEVVEARPRLQWLATELQTISLELQFHVAFTNPATQLNRLRAAAEDHQARALVFGNGVHRGYFVIEELEETFQQTADDGSLIAIGARLALREWVPGADFDPLSPPRRALPSPGLVTATGTQVFNPNQPIGPTNPLPTAAILQLSAAGAGPGVTYSPVPYVQPGVSGVVGSGPLLSMPANPADVPASQIVRSG
jgi:phage protein U